MSSAKYLLLLTVIICIGACSGSNDIVPSGSGTVEAVEITVSAKNAGTVLKRDVSEGDFVKKNDVMLTIETDKLEIQAESAKAALDEIGWNEKLTKAEIELAAERISQAEITLADVKRRFDRIERMTAENAATRDQHDSASTELKLAESRLTSAIKSRDNLDIRLKSFEASRKRIESELALIGLQIEDATVLSPLNAAVVEEYIDPGEIVAPGTPLFKLADISIMRLMVYLGESDLGKIKVGDTVQVAVDSHPGERFPGTITWISPKAEFTPKNVQTRESRVDLVYAVRISIDNPDGVFKIGMPADAFIEGL